MENIHEFNNVNYELYIEVYNTFDKNRHDFHALEAKQNNGYFHI